MHIYVFTASVGSINAFMYEECDMVGLLIWHQGLCQVEMCLFSEDIGINVLHYLKKKNIHCIVDR